MYGAWNKAINYNCCPFISRQKKWSNYTSFRSLQRVDSKVIAHIPNWLFYFLFTITCCIWVNHLNSTWVFDLTCSFPLFILHRMHMHLKFHMPKLGLSCSLGIFTCEFHNFMCRTSTFNACCASWLVSLVTSSAKGSTSPAEFCLVIFGTSWPLLRSCNASFLST